MVTKYLYGCLILLFGVTLSYSQKVSNVSNRQEQSNIIVSYDLETKTPCKIALFVSTNGGTTWQGPLKKVIGDVGTNVGSGNKKITWNVLEEFDELRGNKIVFQIRVAINEIETVKIGEQDWTIKNLNVSKYRNGDIIPEVKDPKEWVKLTTGAWCYYDNDPENGVIYGKLYNWYAVNDARGLAPEGYHLPNDAEWDILVNYLGSHYYAGGKMKEEGFTHWNPPNEGTTNSSGFTSLPAGCRVGSFGYFLGIGDTAHFWSSSERELSNAGVCTMNHYLGDTNSDSRNKNYGVSVRCLRD